MIIFIICFLGGVFTVFSPCVIPVLPFIFSTGVEGKRKQLLNLILGLVLTFGLFTLFGAILIKSLGVSLNSIRFVSAGILGIFGLFLLFPSLDQIIETKISKLFRGKSFSSTGNGFFAGMALGLLWAPCAGPIMGAISSLIATQALSYKLFLFVVSFCLGVALTLFLFGLLSEKITSKLRKSHKLIVNIRRFFGLICIAVAVLFALNKEAVFVSKFSDYIKIENILLDTNSLQESILKDSEFRKEKEKKIKLKITDGRLPMLGKAAEFKDIKIWLNSNKVSIKELKGKVILVDFWTYSCVNCLRTLPYINSWHKKYSDKNFTVIGIHTPEFAFEYEKSNVEKSVQDLKINYPVGLDNDYETWRAYDNHYWPAHYLIDAQGNLRYTHFGEGNYQETELAIQSLIQESGIKTNLKYENDKPPSSFKGQTPETYLGYKRIKNITNKFSHDQCEIFTEQNVLNNQFSLVGTWCIKDEYIDSQNNSKLIFNVNSKKVFLVASSKEKQIIKVIDDQGKIKETEISDSKLYKIIEWDNFSNHTIILEIPDNIRLYAFTFGNFDNNTV